MIKETPVEFRVNEYSDLYPGMQNAENLRPTGKYLEEYRKGGEIAMWIEFEGTVMTYRDEPQYRTILGLFSVRAGVKRVATGTKKTTWMVFEDSIWFTNKQRTFSCKPQHVAASFNKKPRKDA